MSTGLYFHVTRSAGTILTAEIYNEDHQVHVDGNIPSATGAYSDDVLQMQATVDPYPGTESPATDLAGELARLRHVIKRTKDDLNGAAVPYWYSAFSPVANPHAARFARVHRSTDQAIPYKTATPIIFESLRADTDSFWAIANPTRLTVPATGIYHIGACVQWYPSIANGGVIAIYLRHQDGSVIAFQLRTVFTSVGIRSMIIEGEWRLAAGEYIELCVLQTLLTAPLSVKADNFFSVEAWISLIGSSV